MSIKIETAVFGGGCFWCTETVFKTLKGVISVMPGYVGGNTAAPTYEQVCSGKTGHAEVVRIEYDPSIIKYTDLLKVFFATHDPTTMNRQGNDVGAQYRSVILTNSDLQASEAHKVIEELNNSGAFASPIVTEIKPLTDFYEAEEYHKDYYTKNPAAGYCQTVIGPKMTKFRAQYPHLLR